MRKLGLIGNPLGHSWSPAIHTFFLNDADYRLIELKESQLDDFFEKRDFDGINVTIPYKETVLKYLDEIDETAGKIGAVNCIVNQNGRLIGHNTDAKGFADMVRHAGIDVKGKRTAVLGSGGASRAVQAGIKSLGGIPVIVSRTKRDGVITYEQLYDQQADFSILVNTTPVGMKPHDDAQPVDLDRFEKLEAVIDVVANPLRTKLRFEAQQRGLKTLGGFEMLVRQAAIADEWYTTEKVTENQIAACMQMLYQKNRSIVLIGMPTSGKTTIAGKIAEESGRTCIEMDQRIEQQLGTTIAECFKEKGEKYFRDLESDLCASLKEAGSSVVSTGGGVILRKENMRLLGENGLIVWLVRDMDKLYGTASRPLSQNREEILKLYQVREPLYRKYADLIVENNGRPEETVSEILRKSGENL